MICMKGKTDCAGYKDGECISIENCRFQDYFYNDYKEGYSRCGSDLYCLNKVNEYCSSEKSCKYKLIIGSDNMRPEDLKNGMSYKNRNGEMFYIINDKVFVKSDVITLRYHRKLYQELVYYDENFKWVKNKKWDIMEIYDANNKLIWERKEKEIDWSKVPVDTKVLVRNLPEQQWEQRYFAKYEDGEVYAFMNGATSWSISAWSDIISWKEAKLVEDEKMENIDMKKINNQYEEYCKCRGCAECKYFGSLSCKFAWLLDNYNVSPRKEI